MGKTLVLAEKPSVARELARVLGCKQKGDGCLLGGQYIVTWALGHLVTLADLEARGSAHAAGKDAARRHQTDRQAISRGVSPHAPAGCH